MKKLLYFSAQWCGPCRTMVGPIMEELISEGHLIQKIDVDSNPDLSQKYGVRNIPTVILTVNGEEVSRKVGSASKAMYLDMYNQN
jgi:thioredoxin 1